MPRQRHDAFVGEAPAETQILDLSEGKRLCREYRKLHIYQDRCVLRLILFGAADGDAAQANSGEISDQLESRHGIRHDLAYSEGDQAATASANEKAATAYEEAADLAPQAAPTRSLC